MEHQEDTKSDISAKEWLDELLSGNIPDNEIFENAQGRWLEDQIKKHKWKLVKSKSKTHYYKGYGYRNVGSHVMKYIYRSDNHDFEIHFSAYKRHVPLVWVGCKKIKK